MKLNRLVIAEAVRLLGLPGVAGIALVVFSLSYAVSALLPARQELDALRDEVAQAKAREARAKSGVGDASPAGQLKAFYGFLPSQPAAPEWIDKIYAAASKQQVSLLRGEYSLVLDPDTSIARYRILLPVKGSYSQIRGFISGALDTVPSLALDDVNFERQKISDGQVDARVRMTLYLKKA